MPALSKSDTDAIAVWIVEDDLDYRDSITFVLNHTSGINCAAAFYDVEEIESHIDSTYPSTRPDVILMDIGLPGVSGIEGVFRLKERLPDATIVMLTNKDASSYIFDSFRAGASGYLLKDAPVDRLAGAIREAHRGGMPMPPPVAARVMKFFTSQKPVHDYDLTSREGEVLALMADGLPHKQIADRLSISPYTVENHLRNIYRKLHVQSGIEAVAKAFRERLL